MQTQSKTRICLIAHNIRSIYNIGSLFRSADGLGAEALYLTGYSPYPQQINDKRLPHVAQKADKAIHKTALGAERTVKWFHYESIDDAVTDLKQHGYHIVALEQDTKAHQLHDYRTTSNNLAIVLGNEVDGVDEHLLNACDDIIEIPMSGRKESLNVAVAGSIALHWFRHTL